MKIPSIFTLPRNMFDTIDMRFGYHEKLLPQAYKMGLNDAELKGEVTNEVFSQVPPEVVYELSELGVSLKSIIAQMCEWGEHFTQGRN